MSKVRNIMSKKPITISEDADIRKLCKTLAKSRLSGLPVIGKGRNLVGFVSERDIIKAVAKPKFMELTAKTIMIKKVKTVGPDDPLTHASKIFSELDLRILPVIKGGKVVGLITRRAVIERLLSTLH
ncbi:MAG: CBS domain-containing protein [Deltaproteobacteria bacterium]|jgi:CBS domain-containing protein|nr:CBS domain-containing protein [Deltaproteobacteria bacterium]